MLRLLPKTCLILVAFGFVFSAHAQINNVNPAIKIIDGQPYYVHTVQKGQTLSQIAEAYFSNEVSIQSANLGLSKTPASGTKVKIPYSDASLEAMSAKSFQPPKKSEPNIIMMDSDGSTPLKKAVQPPPVVAPTPEPIESIAMDESQPEEEVESQSEDLTPMEEAVLLLTTDDPKVEETVNNSAPVEEIEIIVEEEPVQKPAEQPKETAPEEMPETKVEQPAAKPKETTPEPKEEIIEAPELNPFLEQLDSIEASATQPPVEQPKINTPEALPKPKVEQPQSISTNETLAIMEPDTFSSMESQQAIAELNELSKSIAESLANLAKLRASIENPDEVDPVTGELIEDEPTDEVFMNDFLEGQFTNYFDTAAVGKPYVLKEYFMVNINKNGRLSNVRDERTVSNNNTHVLDLKSLNGLSLMEYPAIGSADLDVALGITMNLTEYEYELKIDGDKIKVLKSPQGFKKFPNNHPHAELIAKSVKNAGQSGKADVVVIEGNKEIATYKKVEYNPFGEVNEVLRNEHILRIEKMEF